MPVFAQRAATWSACRGAARPGGLAPLVFARTLSAASTAAAAAPPSSSRTGPEEQNALSPRWLSDTKARIGKCITFGMSPEKVEEAGQILKVLGRDWRELVAGSEGFLTDPKRAGLHRHGIVWGEQDSMGHVNNVTYVRYAESARCNWTRNYARHVADDVDGVDADRRRAAWENLLTNRGIGLILKSITVDFKFPMTWPDRISVYHKLRSRPTPDSSSLILDVVIMSEVRQRPAARCLEDVVVYDYRQGRKTALEPFMLDELVRTFDLQEAAKRHNHAAVRSIERQVRHLEEQTWDRPDAKEDFGGASS